MIGMPNNRAKAGSPRTEPHLCNDGDRAPRF